MTVEAYAKVNLTLEVFGKRPDGFHALRSVVLPIGLSDTLTFAPSESFSTDTGYPDDLILKAARALGSNDQPFAVHVEKRIPAGGGLGGGSADAAATLLALNELWHLGKSPEELAAIGAQIGSDVPALVLANHYRSPVLMEGRGETVSLLSTRNPKSGTRNFHLVLANPGVPCSTAAVYGKCQSRQDDGGMILEKMRSALVSNDLGRIAAAMMNDLQEPALVICPEIGMTLDALRQAGAAGAMMSGSGSTVFAFVSTETESRDIAITLARQGICAWPATFAGRFT